ncbi:MAG: hypothetical protein JW809_02815 [Pirellulales bacterium]|nr:hypothetical protein [Pirellulales bacterium]
MSLISEEDWQKEIEAAAAEESAFWKGRSIPIQLMVELPFWVMVPDCEIKVTHNGATISAGIRGRYMTVYDGPFFFNSQRNVIFVGPSDELAGGEDPPRLVASSRAPIQRFTRTMVVFRPEVIEDAVLALLEPADASQQESWAVRRVNRSDEYLQSLAYAHIPFLNNMIAAYRITSRDPFAFQVSQWDVPVWFVKHDDRVVRISLMPYWDRDWYPMLRGVSEGEQRPIQTVTPETLSSQLETIAEPGMLEVLNARSLYYRGHLDDAVRFAVTAIEVALEAQISRLLGDKGWTKQQIQDRLSETRNSFDKRVADYERISVTRIPGPILSPIPYINGIRLKSELEKVRKLRHKIVHEGLRVDVHSRGPMLRAIETMTWLYDWLSWTEGRAKDESEYYALFEAMRGQHIPRYAVEYSDVGVVVLPDKQGGKHVGAMLRSQYLALLEGKGSDIELFALMSFDWLGVEYEDAPPEPEDSPTVHERYHIRYKERHAVVFCFECDSLVESCAVWNVVSRLAESERHQKGDCSALCIINHQKDRPFALRSVENAVPDDARIIAEQHGLTLITAADLRLLVQGVKELGWDVEKVRCLLFAPGRQGSTPPVYREIGILAHFFGQLSVMDVELRAGETINFGDTLGVRLGEQYHEEAVESLQVGQNPVANAVGPCRVGIKTTLQRSSLHVGQKVYRRCG